MCNVFRMYQKSAKLCQMCKSVQHVQKCTKCANLFKMCKSVQNVQKCAKCAKYAKLCKMCKADRANRANSANSANSDTKVENGITYLGKPHWESCRVYSGIAQIAIAPPPLPPFTQTGTPGHLYLGRLEQMPFELQFSLQKCPKPSWQGFRPPKPSTWPFERGQFFSN